jgi:hypothetical protein
MEHYMRLMIPTTLAGALLSFAAVAADAHAATVDRFQFQNASGFCQAALPVFEGNIRKRPTAIANEGTANAFVSCSMQTNPEDANSTIEEVNLVLYNRGATAVEVTCNLIHSFQAGGLVVPRVLSVPVGDRAFFTWTAEDLGVPEIEFANFNCNLPVGIEIGYGFYSQGYEVGT